MGSPSSDPSQEGKKEEKRETTRIFQRSKQYCARFHHVGNNTELGKDSTLPRTAGGPHVVVALPCCAAHRWSR